MSRIDDTLARMRQAGKLRNIKDKGDLGEDAVLDICLAIKRQIGGFVIQSYAYPYASNREGKNYTGNIKLENGQFVEYTDIKGLTDEIDVLLVTPYRIFPIEVKSYKAKIRVYDHWMDRDNNGSGTRGMAKVDKSPIAQAEKHARHLYHQIHMCLPDGKPDYIVPMVCFVDRCVVDDDRSDAMQAYLPVTILNTLRPTIVQYNAPLRYALDLEAIKRRLNEIKTTTRKEFGL